MDPQLFLGENAFGKMYSGKHRFTNLEKKIFCEKLLAPNLDVHSLGVSQYIRLLFNHQKYIFIFRQNLKYLLVFTWSWVPPFD